MKKSKGKKGKKGKRRKVNAARVKEQLEKGNFKHPYLTLPEGMDLFKAEFPKGKTTKTYHLNIIPFVAGPFCREENEGELWWRAKYDAGKNIGPDEVTLASPRTIGKKCPMYEAWKALADDPDIDDDDIKDIRPKSREMYYVTDAKENDGIVYLLDISYFLFGKLLDKELKSEDGEEHLAFSDVEDGCTLKIRFSQSTYGKATYQEVDKIDFETRKGDEISDETIDSLKDPIELIEFKPYPEIKKLIEGDGEDEDEDEIPMDYEKKGKRKPKKKTSSDKKGKKKPKKKGKKKTPAEEIKEKITEALEDMDRPSLKKYVKSEGLSIKFTPKKDDDAMRAEILKAMSYSADEEDEDDEEDW